MLLHHIPWKPLSTLHERVNNRQVTSEHYYAVSFKRIPLDGCIYADDKDLINDSEEKNKR